ncbi:hypothetical protein [Paludisphaera soli]|uniref:hypothetical protein n=1 Tax=Paludisphaera soli TaxID=2712865 RepID=UPI0013EC9235|nr:hypothetical protein [Paludisphaera soli]
MEHGATCEEVRDQVCLIAKKSRRKKKVRVVHTFRVGGCKIVVTGLTRYDQAAMALALRRGAASVERELAGGADAQPA